MFSFLFFFIVYLKVDRREEYYQPYQNTDNSNEDHFLYINGDMHNRMIGEYANADWGVYNAISNGGNLPCMWRTLTSPEWGYLLSKRENALNLQGHATVNGIQGYILLPDEWNLPKGVVFTVGVPNYAQNTYTLEDWEKMEGNGAVFLPINDFGDINGYEGHYWTSSDNRNDNHVTYLLIENSVRAYTGEPILRLFNMSVRLVQDVK